MDVDTKIAVLIRTARIAAGWTQQEFADAMGYHKTSLARLETLEGGTSAKFFLKALDLFKSVGIKIDLHDDKIVMTISDEAINYAAMRLKNTSLRRSDRKANND